MLKSFLRIFTGAAVCVLAACGGNEITDSLDIDREYRSPRLRTDIRDAEFVERLTWESSVEELENGFVRKAFPMPPGLAFSMSSLDISGSSDPFAVPVKPSRLSKAGFREVLESAGIRFSEGSSVHYDEEKWALIVVNTSEQMELVDAYLESIVYDEETKLFIRAEIYEISHLQAIQLADSAAHESEHTPEREAVLQAVKAGKARLVAAPSVMGRSGQRSKVEVTSRNRSEFSISSEEEDSSGKGKVPGESGPASRFEVDPVLGADGYTIDLNFSLEHPIPVGPAEGESKQAAGPGAFRQAGITSTVTLTHGSFVLVGSWDSGEDSVHSVFLTATRQYLEDIKPMIKVDSGQK
jgi:hypothetical protein